MQRFRKAIYFFTIFVLLVSACTSVQAPKTDTALLGQEVENVNAAPNSPAPENEEPTDQPEPNECLNCHSDKDLLIETAEVIEEIAESESKGVG
jgi:hypothetical protein